MEPRLVAEKLAWLSSTQGGRALSIRERAAKPSGFSFFAPDFALNSSSPWLCGSEMEWPPRLENQPAPAVLHRTEPSSAVFAALIEDILQRIQGKEFEKVVPVVCAEYGLSVAPDASHFCPTWSLVPPNMWAYGFAHGSEGMAGVTPEVLFSRSGSRLRTMALAGTAATDSGHNLLEDQKELREHQLVIDHIFSELRSFGRVELGETIEREYGVIKHLFTPIEVQLTSNPSFMDLVVRLHPTAALGGWPRRPAVKWLAQQKFHHGRGRFGAPFGWYDPASEQAECVVAIRGVQWQGSRALVFTGCGVVQGSNALREWNELALKRKSTLQRLGWELK